MGCKGVYTKRTFTPFVHAHAGRTRTYPPFFADDEKGKIKDRFSMGLSESKNTKKINPSKACKWSLISLKIAMYSIVGIITMSTLLMFSGYYLYPYFPKQTSMVASFLDFYCQKLIGYDIESEFNTIYGPFDVQDKSKLQTIDGLAVLIKKTRDKTEINPEKTNEMFFKIGIKNIGNKNLLVPDMSFSQRIGCYKLEPQKTNKTVLAAILIQDNKEEKFYYKVEKSEGYMYIPPEKMIVNHIPMPPGININSKEIYIQIELKIEKYYTKNGTDYEEKNGVLVSNKIRLK
jgi:hypothetical protein